MVRFAELSVLYIKWMIKQLLNSVFAKYRDLSVAHRSFICLCLRHRQINDLFATDKSRYFARPRPIIVYYHLNARMTSQAMRLNQRSEEGLESGFMSCRLPRLKNFRLALLGRVSHVTFPRKTFVELQSHFVHLFFTQAVEKYSANLSRQLQSMRRSHSRWLLAQWQNIRAAAESEWWVRIYIRIEERDWQWIRLTLYCLASVAYLPLAFYSG